MSSRGITLPASIPPNAPLAGVVSTSPVRRPSLFKTSDNVDIDIHMCFGCGLCVAACPNQAIEFVPRADIPGHSRFLVGENDHGSEDPYRQSKCTIPCMTQRVQEMSRGLPPESLRHPPQSKRDFSIPRKEGGPDHLDPADPWEDYCNGCGACVESCPQGAITIHFGEKRMRPEIPFEGSLCHDCVNN